MDETEFDHAVIHIDDWDAANHFYGQVLGADLVENPEGQDNPLGACGADFAFRRARRPTRTSPGSSRAA